MPLWYDLSMITQSKTTPERLEELQTEVTFLKGQIVELTVQNNWFKKQLFGIKSEKIIAKPKNEEQLYFEGFDQLAKLPEEKSKISGH